MTELKTNLPVHTRPGRRKEPGRETHFILAEAMRAEKFLTENSTLKKKKITFSEANTVLGRLRKTMGFFFPLS